MPSKGYCMVMPLYEGGDLSQYFESNRIQELWKDEIILKLFLQIVSAVEYLHNKNIIYRDAKPQNCMLDKNLNIAITDFGISCLSIPDSNDHTVEVGTKFYCAPEMEDQEYDNSVDIWAIGVILYQLLYNKFPLTEDQLLKNKYDIYFAEFDEKENRGISEKCWDKLN